MSAFIRRVPLLKVSKLFKSDSSARDILIHFKSVKIITIEQIFNTFHGETINIEGFDTEWKNNTVEIYAIFEART